MKKIKIDELKKIEVEILNYVDKFCKDNNIKYWLDSGTLIGAVRHKGFIAWDDDIDIGMLREDYDKFVKIFNNENSKYKLFSPEIDNKWYFPYAKVVDTSTVLFEPNEEVGIKYSIFIDVFAFDKVPNDSKKREKLYKKRDFYKKMSVFQQFNNSTITDKKLHKFLRNIVHLITNVLPKGFFNRKVIQNAKKYNSSDSQIVGCLVGITKKTAPKEYLSKFTEISFEGNKYSVPYKYDEWLKCFYGNYMILPPKSEQVTHHKFVAYHCDIKNKESEK